MKTNISKNSEVLGGALVFTGTRVPVETLFDHIRQDISIATFWRNSPR
ncbi:MAG: DUF433 domain-containing protein [Bacteroidia bacterium]